MHHCTEYLPLGVKSILPAIHALTGSDSTSKVSNKRIAPSKAEYFAQQLQNFGKTPINDEMISTAETFLVSCLARKSSNASTFKELRLEQYHKKAFKFDLEKIVPTSAKIRLHILRAYYQTYMWISAPYVSKCEIDPTHYGYELQIDILVPAITNNKSMPPDFPSPCNCLKCARATICPCRSRNISCCVFCKCENSCINLN